MTIELLVDVDGVHLMQDGKCILSADKCQTDDYIIWKLRKMMCSGDL